MNHRSPLLAGLGVVSLSWCLAAGAALKPGDPAPEFTTQAAQAGVAFDYSLAKALAQGPVVLYFYPAAFTPGCTIEAHEFAEAVDDFAALGATVVGVSTDDIETLKKFSVSECRGKFAVAADPDQKITKAYDAVLMKMTSKADRTSYVIAPDGHVLYEYTALKPDQHVENTLQALRDWKAKAPAAP